VDFEVRPSSKLGARDLTCIKSYPLDDAMVTASQRRPLPRQILGTFLVPVLVVQAHADDVIANEDRTRGIAQHAAVLI
jgi:hypothetical protein